MYTYKELLEYLEKYNINKSDVIESEGYGKITSNVVIAPMWKVSIFENKGLEITKLNDKVFRLKNKNIEFVFIEMNQIGAPAIIEEMLTLGLTKCKNILFIGSAGSLSKNLNIGDIGIIESSICGTGATRYLYKSLKDNFGSVSYPNKESYEKILKVCKTFNCNVESCINYSVDTIFAQFSQIENIISLKAKTIEMEISTFYEVSSLLNLKAVALTIISDNIVNKKTLYSGRSKEDRERRYYVRSEILPNIIIEYFKKD